MQALVMSDTSIVTLEVVLTVQRLVHKFGAEQDSLTWELILDITEALMKSSQVRCLLCSHVFSWTCLNIRILLVCEHSAIATLIVSRRVCLWVCLSVVMSVFSKCFSSGSSCQNKQIF